MSSVGFAVHGGRPDALALAGKASERLRAEGVDVVVATLTHASREEGERELEDLTPDLFVSLGGDGTFLRTARRAHAVDAPILGINFGRVGYLLDGPRDDLDRLILDALAGRALLERRAGIEVSFSSASSAHGPLFGLNELSVEKTVPGHVVRLSAEIDGEAFLTYSADGVLLATPTGSTAYNLSAGGPVLSPLLDVFVMTPVAPHLVIDRSVVLGGEQKVGLTVVGDRPVVCVLDGLSVATLAPNDRLEVRRHPRWLKVVTSQQRGMGRRLRESLRQGHE